jgi:hypothetical protein
MAWPEVKLLGNHLIVSTGSELNALEAISTLQKTALGGKQDSNEM